MKVTIILLHESRLVLCNYVIISKMAEELLKRGCRESLQRFAESG
jgi:hypothetical protein